MDSVYGAGSFLAQPPSDGRIIIGLLPFILQLPRIIFNILRAACRSLDRSETVAAFDIQLVIFNK